MSEFKSKPKPKFFSKNSKPPFDRKRKFDDRKNSKRGDKPNPTTWNPIAEWYNDHLSDPDSHHAKVVLPKLVKLIQENTNPGFKILDLGCGQGILAANLPTELNARFTGIDNSRELIRIAENRQLPQTEFIYADAANLPDYLKQAQFDIATFVLSIQNMRDLNGAISGAAAAVNQGGKIILVITHPTFRVPKHSDWYENSSKQSIFRAVDLYLSDAEIAIEEKPFKSKLNEFKSVETFTFHHPIQSYIKAFKQAGLALIDMEEWISHKVSEPGNPKAEMENRSRREIPMFMALVAQKL